MSATKKIVIFVILTGLCLFFINESAFTLQWTCYCYDENLALAQCEDVCGAGKCEGWMRSMTGTCYGGACLVNVWVTCTDSGPYSVRFTFVCPIDCGLFPW